MMKWFIPIVIIIFLNACQSTARYRTIKKSRQNYSKQNNFRATSLGDYIHSWLGVPYQYGGLSRSGIDCSGFTLTVYQEIYNFELPRTALDQYKLGRKIKSTQLQEGDLVFFRGVIGAGIDHVGIYLNNGQFVHASTSNGVTISDLSEDYYQERYVGACRY